MAGRTLTPDIVIFGAGIAGLWLLARLRAAGYDALLLERDAVGGGQSIASQGIIHSGLKYTLSGKINALAAEICAMPERWRAALRGEGPVDLSAARVNADTQSLLIPKGVIGGVIRLVSTRALGGAAQAVSESGWPENLKDSGFQGSLVHLGEPVLDIPSVIRALAEPYENFIRHSPPGMEAATEENGNIESLRCGDHIIKARHYIFTAAAGNAAMAEKLGHDKGLKSQARPLLMGMIRNAPFPLYAHMVGASDKPVMTVTTHEAEDGALIWYLGAGVAERPKEADPQNVYRAALQILREYLPAIDTARFEWAALPVDRIEGKSETGRALPDTPTIHMAGDALYCWPTKLTFAPLLSDMVMKKLEAAGTLPSNTGGIYDFLPPAPYAAAPWDQAQWTTLSGSARSAART